MVVAKSASLDDSLRGRHRGEVSIEDAIELLIEESVILTRLEISDGLFAVS